MATGQILLDTMELVNAELQLQVGEADVSRGLSALNRSQDFLEGLLAQQRHFLPNTTTTVSILSGNPTSVWPTGYLRIDEIQLLNVVTGLPDWTIDPETVPPVQSSSFPLGLVSPTGGRPATFWGNGTTLYWNPLPPQNDTARIYGFSAAGDITAGSTFVYPDYCLLPVATFAAKLMKLGVGDPTPDLDGLSKSVFETAVRQMGRFVSNHTTRPSYRYFHST